MLRYSAPRARKTGGPVTTFTRTCARLHTSQKCGSLSALHCSATVQSSLRARTSLIIILFSICSTTTFTTVTDVNSLAYTSLSTCYMMLRCVGSYNSFLLRHMRRHKSEKIQNNNEHTHTHIYIYMINIRQHSTTRSFTSNYSARTALLQQNRSHPLTHLIRTHVGLKSRLRARLALLSATGQTVLLDSLLLTQLSLMSPSRYTFVQYVMLFKLLTQKVLWFPVFMPDSRFFIILQNLFNAFLCCP